MQTFLTRISYHRSFQDLDQLRLGKQRQEALQILRNLLGIQVIYPHHPVMAMWRGWEPELAVYGAMACLQFSLRGGKDRTMEHFVVLSKDLAQQGRPYRRMPPWMQDKNLLRSHRSNLYRKDARFYSAFGTRHTPLGMPYLWPHSFEDGSYELRLSEADRKRLRDGERHLPDDMSNLVKNS